MRIPAAVAFGSGHEVGERNKIEVASVADDEDRSLMMLMSREVQGRRRRVEAKTVRLKSILAKKSYSTIILYQSEGDGGHEDDRRACKRDKNQAEAK